MEAGEFDQSAPVIGTVATGIEWLERCQRGSPELPTAAHQAEQMQEGHGTGQGAGEVGLTVGQHPVKRTFKGGNVFGKANRQRLQSLCGSQFCYYTMNLDDQLAQGRPIFAKDLAADQVVRLYSGSTFVNGDDACVAKVLGNAGFLDEAHTTMDLDRVVANLLA